MPRAKCPPTEDIVRAITTADWDAKRGRLQSSFFEGTGVSVSRLAVLPLTTLVEIFRRDLHKPPHILRATAEINIGVLQQVGRNFVNPTELSVEEVPLENNPAHAEVVERITRGLSKALNRVVIIRPVEGNSEIMETRS